MLLKRIIHLALGITMALFTAQSIDSLTVQSARLAKVLWANQQQFALTSGWIDVHVMHPKDMKCHECWGDQWADAQGNHVEVMAQEDFPASYPVSQRAKMQNEITQHEVMHIVLTKLGVPDKVQDDLIEGLRPAMRQHK